MSDDGSNAPGRPGGPLSPQALSIEDAARILTAAGGQRVSVEMIREDLDAGAPRNADGTLNLVHYAAWLAREAQGAEGPSEQGSRDDQRGQVK